MLKTALPPGPKASVLDPSKVKPEPVANALVLDAYTTPPDVNDVKPVPPFVVANVPANVTAPVVAVEGVKPVVPAVKDVTPVLTEPATFA
jgi:hypothetical protein